MGEFTIPDELRTHVTESLGPKGREWLADLPRIVAEIEWMWEIRSGEPLAAGEYNYVAPATRTDGEQVVIKIAPPFEHDECYSEAAFLKHKAGAGCVRLLAADREYRAIMLERAIPGLNLVELFGRNEGEMIAPAAAVLKRILEPPPQAVNGIIRLDNWFAHLERAEGTDFPSRYVEKALGFYRELSRRAELFYLHGDFHPGNIVNATREPYLAIDPKGIVGPMGYDIAVFLNNIHWFHADHTDLTKKLARAVRQFASAFELPEIDVRKWAYAVQVMGSWWNFDEMPALYSGGVVKADIWEV